MSRLSSRFTLHVSPSTFWSLAALALTLFAFALRLWRLDAVPPGWRDDELINSLVISQKALDGQLAVYYPDASGHEALYHLLNAAMLALFGPTVPGIRLLSAILGTLTIPLTYRLGGMLVGRPAGFIAAAVLAVSFWSLMYSRIGLRHISLPVFSMLAFIFFWQGLRRRGPGCHVTLSPRHLVTLSPFLLAGFVMGAGFYTYFASRGVPLVLLAFCAYLWVVDRPRLRRNWRGLALMFGLTAVLSLPLVITLARQPASDARVAELAVPLIEAARGNFAVLWKHVRLTLSMFHASGDGEWLYNIPGRPLFGPIGALFFWLGILISAIRLSLLVIRKSALLDNSPLTAHASAFLLIWWLAGIAPAFLSTPPASLSHTILAQPAVYLLAVVPLSAIGGRYSVIGTTSTDGRILNTGYRLLVTVLALLLLLTTVNRDLPDYFRHWAERGNVRFLYHADLDDVADYLAEHPEIRDFAISNLLAGPWASIALELELAEAGVSGARPRWYHPEQAIILEPALAFSGYPVVAAAYENWLQPLRSELVGGYQFSQVVADVEKPATSRTCFQNGLCLTWAGYDAGTQRLELAWEVARPLELPAQPLISQPPPPGVYAGPRLSVFAHLWDADGQFLAGADGLWVDPATLRAGDRFLQRHQFHLNPGQQAAYAVFGLYDPKTGERIMTEDGRDSLRLAIED